MSCSLPPIDENCADPAYADANPEICATYPRLFLVPENNIIQPGDTVTFTVILRQGARETVLTRGLTFSIADFGVAMINDIGVATGVLAGETIVTVAWQNLTAHATLRVVVNCSEVDTDYLILIDNSKSMTQAAYTASSKLAYAKATASGWCDSVNYSKDRVGVMKFSDDADSVIGFQESAAPAKVAIASIASSVFTTDIAEALQTASDYFDAQSSTGVRAIILFSDGEKNEGDDPYPIAKAFKEAGGFIIVVATRAWGVHFELLNKIASAGFFLSAHATTESEIPATLAGLKSLICGGDCQPEAGTFPTAQLNYTGFINWDVTQGRVDLIGLGVWDQRPGTGLSVDLCGTGDAGYPYPGQEFGLGQLTSKVETDYADGEEYRFSIKVSGSLPLGTPTGAGTWTIRVRAGDSLDELITITDGGQDFELHEFEWTQAGDFTGPIIIEQTVQTGHHNVGALIDEVLLENLTTSTVILDDNFDTENPQTIPPGQSSYYSCLESPPGAQAADPVPPTPTLAEGS